MLVECTPIFATLMRQAYPNQGVNTLSWVIESYIGLSSMICATPLSLQMVWRRSLHGEKGEGAGKERKGRERRESHASFTHPKEGTALALHMGRWHGSNLSRVKQARPVSANNSDEISNPHFMHVSSVLGFARGSMKMNGYLFSNVWIQRISYTMICC